ncbi:glycosyltransferase family 4 protein [Methylobacterium durans]|uniref:Glycosyl transferase family 1 domain-containing protein n=1 Tax=Methylobacterium durans TaxID=2202825 RepID=A0A2U8W6P2_9HYPH|nr:glycosyltransferase family 1 protein [Methylobacterium durans]AWN41747.1 hypothetical protein DK389_16065 [Methylobacterium durans]
MDTLEAGDVTIYYEISPILLSQWTGIPAVAAAYAQEICSIGSDRFQFFFDDVIIPRDAIAETLTRRTGSFLSRALEFRRAQFSPLDVFSREGINVGLYPSVKHEPGIFDKEISFVHDLSTHITPFYHTIHNIKYHLEYLAEEIRTNDLTLAVSRSTLDDIKYYFGTEEDRLGVVYNAVSWPEEFAVKFMAELGSAYVEPYILILGTREPRKNHQIIFDMLTRWPELLEKYRFVFTGRSGWLEDQLSVPSTVMRGFESGRIIYTGFVDEYTKYKLLRLAYFSIYGSMFEGFGLPIIESMSVGTPCIASFSSSHPEVGGRAALYFDPLSAESLFERVEFLGRLSDEDARALSEASVEESRKFTWKSSFQELCYQIGKVLVFD